MINFFLIKSSYASPRSFTAYGCRNGIHWRTHSVSTYAKAGIQLGFSYQRIRPGTASYFHSSIYVNSTPIEIYIQRHNKRNRHLLCSSACYNIDKERS